MRIRAEDPACTIDGMCAVAPASPEDNPRLKRLLDATAAVPTASDAYSQARAAVSTLAAARPLFVQVETRCREELPKISPAGLLTACYGGSDHPVHPSQVGLMLWGGRDETFDLGADTTTIVVWRVSELYPEPERAEPLNEVAHLLQVAEDARRRLLEARNALTSELLALEGTPVHLINCEERGNRDVGGPLVESRWGWVQTVDLTADQQRIHRLHIVRPRWAGGEQFYPKARRNSQIIPVTSIRPVDAG